MIKHILTDPLGLLNNEAIEEIQLALSKGRYDSVLLCWLPKPYKVAAYIDFYQDDKIPDDKKYEYFCWVWCDVEGGYN
ncbi:hypothetical protein D3C74_137800 [compost metagenome]